MDSDTRPKSDTKSGNIIAMAMDKEESSLASYVSGPAASADTVLESESADASSTKFRSDAKKALDLEMSKAKYDAAKERVKKLHDEFIALEDQLGTEVNNLDEARGQLVSQIQGIEGGSIIPSPDTSSSIDTRTQRIVDAVAKNVQSAQKALIFTPSTSVIVKNGDAVHIASIVAAAQASRNAANASLNFQHDADEASKQSKTAATASREAAKAAIGHVVSAAVSAKASQEAAHASQNALQSAAVASQSAIAAAKESREAADAAQSALVYTQGVSSKVGSLVEQTEAEASRIAAAGQVTDEAKKAMQAALEQSSQIVDYNTHAAQAVAQDAGFVSSAAKTVASFLQNIFHDARAVHKAALNAKKKIKKSVAAVAAEASASADDAKRSAQAAALDASRAKEAGSGADRALRDALAEASNADGVVSRIRKAELEVARLASHAGLAARVASDAAAGAADGEKAAMAASYEAKARLRGIQAEAAARWKSIRDPWGVSPVATPPSVGFGWQPDSIVGSPQGRIAVSVPPVVHAYGASSRSSLMQSKELVDTVIVLMQQLTHSLEGVLYGGGADGCQRVRELLAWYQGQMAEYHEEGLRLAQGLTDSDMQLVEEYAQAQVASFSSELEQAVADTSSMCSMPTAYFLPDVPTADMPRPRTIGVSQPIAFGQAVTGVSPMSIGIGQPISVGFSGLSQRRKAVDGAKERVEALKAQLLAAENQEQEASSAPALSPSGKVAREEAEVAELKAEVASLLARGGGAAEAAAAGRA